MKYYEDEQAVQNIEKSNVSKMKSKSMKKGRLEVEVLSSKGRIKSTG